MVVGVRTALPTAAFHVCPLLAGQPCKSACLRRLLAHGGLLLGKAASPACALGKSGSLRGDHKNCVPRTRFCHFLTFIFLTAWSCACALPTHSSPSGRAVSVSLRWGGQPCLRRGPALPKPSGCSRQLLSPNSFCKTSAEQSWCSSLGSPVPKYLQHALESHMLAVTLPTTPAQGDGCRSGRGECTLVSWLQDFFKAGVSPVS